MNRSLRVAMSSGIAGLIGVAGLAATAFAQTGAATASKPDLAKAQQIVTQVCGACHGTDGNSPTAANPHLAGQHAEYTSRQLRHFRDGVRKNPIMLGMTAALSDADMRALGAYFARQKPKPGAARDAELVKLGQQIYRGGDLTRGLPACAGCHSPNGAGMPANYPRLSGQYADYTYAQLKAFRDDQRGMDTDGKDPNGRIMAQIAARMSEREMRAVAEYTSGLM